MPEPAAGAPTTEPATVDVQALIDLCESHAAVLSMGPTAFQLEQSVNFLVATLPIALRKLARAEAGT